MVGSLRSDIRSDINITPLVDVVLVLLIIFMVITPLMQTGYEVISPKTNVSPAPVGETQIVVSVLRGGGIFLNREAMTSALLEKKLSAILGQSASRVVFFSAEDEANYGAVVSVLDAVRTAGATRIAIAPSPAELGLK